MTTVQRLRDWFASKPRYPWALESRTLVEPFLVPEVNLLLCDMVITDPDMPAINGRKLLMPVAGLYKHARDETPADIEQNEATGVITVDFFVGPRSRMLTFTLREPLPPLAQTI